MSDLQTKLRKSLAFEHNQWVAKCDKLTLECAEYRRALEHTNEYCLCERFKTPGFDYGEEHRYRGKAGAGKRWLTPKDKVQAVLAKYPKSEEHE